MSAQTVVAVTQEDRELAQRIMSWVRGFGVTLPYDGHFVTQEVAKHRLTSQAAQPAEADGVDLTGLRGVDKLARLMAWHHFGIRWEHLEKVSQQEITAACQAAFDWMNRPLPERQASLAATPKAPVTDAGEVPADCSCEVAFGQDDGCPVHGTGTAWRAANPQADMRARPYGQFATPPAPNDDLRAALEEAIDRMGWPEIHAFQDELRKGQDVREDAGGFMLRAIKALFGIKPTDPVTTYQQAARALVDAALKENRRG
jgi:hypothetical protein